MLLFTPKYGNAVPFMTYDDEPTDYDINSVRLGVVSIFRQTIDGFEKVVIDETGWSWYIVYEGETKEVNGAEFHCAWVG